MARKGKRAIFEPPTEEQRERFLELIREGKTRQEAAEEVGSTSTRFRTFINGSSEESQRFAERYLEALADAGRAPSPLAQRVKEAESIHLAHRLLDESIMRALDPERGKVGASNRILYNLSLLKVSDFQPLLEARTRHIHEGAVGVYALPKIDTDKWTLEQHEEFVRLEARRNELLAIARPDPPAPAPPALPAPASEVIDQEAVEV
jgi:hypothetical protein